MLEINPEIVSQIIDRAQEFHVKEAVTITEVPLSPADDWAQQILADHKEDPTFDQLIETINDLEPDQQVELVALTWLGRGDYDIAEWGDAVNQAKDRWNPRSAEYLVGTPMLADYLAEGLDLHGYTR